MKIELLPVERWPELEQALREANCEDVLPKPEQAIMLGAFEGEKLIGAIGAERVWNVSPIWVEKSFRGNGLPMMLAQQLATYNSERLREYCSTSSPHVERLIYSMGFVPTLGQTWRRDRG